MGVKRFIRVNILQPIASIFVGKKDGADAAASVMDWLVTESETVVKAVKESPEGQKILALINAANETGKSGSDKMNDILGAASDIVLSLVAKGGAQAAVKDVETIARNVIESFLADAKATKSGSIFTAIASALGVKL